MHPTDSLFSYDEGIFMPFEQLQFFREDDSIQLSKAVSNKKKTPVLNRHESLEALLAGELNFHHEESGYASHDMHSFAAKFPPQLPRVFIRNLTDPGDIVLDPMMGSGTTVVEALLAGRQGIGLDIDPLAIRISCVKTAPLTIHLLHQEIYEVMRRARMLLAERDRLERECCLRFDARTKAFLDYWFLPTTQRELLALVMAIQEVTDDATRRFLELTFSSIIVTKSGGASRARDLAHSRPHLDRTKVPKDTLTLFRFRLRKNLQSIAHLPSNGSRAITLAGDARCLPLADGVVDLIVTSPPYANAIDYMRAHKFSLVWLGSSVTELSDVRAEYIGSERLKGAVHTALPEQPKSVLHRLWERDRHKAAILQKYFCEMRGVLGEMYRVLRNQAPAVVVVGTSLMRGLDVQTHTCLAAIAADVGFEVAGITKRSLDRNRRMMPARSGNKSGSMIAQRMQEEYVIGLVKP